MSSFDFVGIFQKAINGALRELEAKDKVREELIKETRVTNRLIREAVFLIHSNRMEKAKEKLRKAWEHINELFDKAKKFPDLAYGGILGNSFQEYVEAYALIKIIEEYKIPAYEELKIPPSFYLTGLADLIGELRRRILDLLREERLDEAEFMFKLMENLYSVLREVDYPDALVPGLRRKCDVGRHLIETTRSNILEAKMKAELVKNIKKILKLERTIRRGIDDEKN